MNTRCSRPCDRPLALRRFVELTSSNWNTVHTAMSYAVDGEIIMLSPIANGAFVTNGPLVSVKQSPLLKSLKLQLNSRLPGGLGNGSGKGPNGLWDSEK